MIAHGADVNARHQESGATPLQYAVLKGGVKMARLIFKAGAQVNGDYRDGQSLFHVAAARGICPVIDALVQAKADIEALDSNGNTPLDTAVLHGQPFAVDDSAPHHADATYVSSAQTGAALYTKPACAVLPTYCHL